MDAHAESEATLTGRSISPGLALGPAELGSVLLGGVTCSALVRAGLIEELRPGAAARADLFFGTDEAPYCSTAF